MTWFYVGAAVITAVGTIASARQQQAAAQSQANIQDYNSEVATIQAKQTNAAASNEQDEQRKRARAVIGQQLATSAEAGAGLNGDLLRQSIFDTEADTQAIRYQGNLKAQGLTDQSAINASGATASRAQGRAAMDAGLLNAAGSLVGGASKGSYYNAKAKA